MNTPAASIRVVDIPQNDTQERDTHLASLFALAERGMDFASIVSAVYAADALDVALEPHRRGSYSPSAVFFCAAAFALLFVFLLERHGAYRRSMSLLAIRETERILRVTLQSFLIALLAAYLCAAPPSRLGLGLALVLVPLFLTLEKWEMHNLVCALRSKGYGTRRAIILGTGTAGRRIYSALVRSPKFGVDPVAFVDEDPQALSGEIYESSYKRTRPAKVLAGPLCRELFRELNASVLVVASAGMDRQAMLGTIAKASEAGVSTYFAPGDFLEPGYWVDYAELDGIMLAHLSRGSTRLVYESAKRLLDILLAGGLLLLFSPIAAIIAIAVKSTSPGPALFRQDRVGKVGRPFSMYKFRTMYCDVPAYGYSPKVEEDPRVTAIGRLLRRTSLDEVPQLINVLLGHMSLVGPRPEMPFIVQQYSALQRQRLAVKPGMTGLWQISADRASQIHENMEYDLYYVRHRSLFMDVAILLHTVLFAARGV